MVNFLRCIFQFIYQHRLKITDLGRVYAIIQAYYFKEGMDFATKHVEVDTFKFSIPNKIRPQD